MSKIKKNIQQSGSRNFTKFTLLAFVLPFVIFLFTMARSVYNLDSAELSTASAMLGITRATGYPLYLMLGHMWSKLPIGDVGFRLNLFSAFNGALTIALLQVILSRLRVYPLVAAGALGLLVSAPFFWGFSLVAEVYTLHTAIMAGLILSLLLWQERPTPARLALSVGLVGLGVSNHVSTILFVPGCLWFVLDSHPQKALQPASLGLALLAALIGLSPYLYLPIRYAAQPVYNYAGQFDANGVFRAVNLQTLEGFWWLISGQQFENFMPGATSFNLLDELRLFFSSLVVSFAGVGIGPGILGIYVAFKRQRALGALCLLFFLCYTAFFITYGVPDKETMFLPAYLIWTVWVALGYQWLLGWLVPEQKKRKTKAKSSNRSLKVWVALVFPLVAAAVIGINWGKVDLSADNTSRELGEHIFSQVADNALIVGGWDTVGVMQYLQFIEAQRPDIFLVNIFLISGADVEVLMINSAQHRPVYTTILTDRIEDELVIEKEFSMEADVAPMYRLWPGDD